MLATNSLFNARSMLLIFDLLTLEHALVGSRATRSGKEQV
jgi:hypothetical protein